MNIDTVTVSADFPAETRKKRFRKGLHLFNLHSWAPWDFNPFHIADENRIDISFGATVMSQNLLSSTSGYLAYGYAPNSAAACAEESTITDLRRNLNCRSNTVEASSCFTA